MTPLSVLARFRAMTPARRRRALRCGWELVRASVQVAVVHRRRISPLLGEAGPVIDVAAESPPPRGDVAAGLDVGRQVALIAAVMPWHPGCLRQVLACRRVLAGEEIGHVVHLGVADATDLGAHAWVSVGPVVVNGEVGRDAHTPVASYRWEPPTGVSR